MEEYGYLSPDEKIEKFLEKKINNNQNITIITIIMFAALIIPFIISVITGIIKDLNNGVSMLNIIIPLGPLMLVSLAFVLTNSKYTPPNARERRHQKYRKMVGLPERRPVNILFTDNKNIKIVNAKFVKRTEHGYIFGQEKKFLVETGRFSAIDVYFEEIPQKGKEYFLICIENFETPIAVFKGRYNGNKYLTWDCK